MSTQWMVQTHGDPLGAVRALIHEVWRQAGLEGMLLPLNGSEDGLPHPRLASDPAALEQVNPFKPLMTMNAARLIPNLVKGGQPGKLGALLRPCEMRALVEMTKHGGAPNAIKLDGFLTVCVDCLGTVPLDEYQWRVARKGAPGKLADETLQFARQGGIADYRYRSACQICASPAAGAADLNIHVLGLPVRQYILVSAANGDGRFHLDQITDGPATPDLVEQHAHVIERMIARHHATLERVSQHLGELLPQGIGELAAKLEACGDCQVCMNVCPICSVDTPYRDPAGHYRHADITRWLVSCVGCGMCEQSCDSHLPLSIIFGHIRNILAEELDYAPGESFDRALPVIQ